MTVTGSSLRVQGGLLDQARQVGAKGFIPARAGRPRATCRVRAGAGVHPCACRAATISGRQPKRQPGSSLRVQGGQVSGLDPPFLPRFIPARAGRPLALGNISVAQRVHPCACRAATVMLCGLLGSTGSSLRVQGGPLHINL